MSINKFIGIGNICADVEIRTVGQSQVGKFNLAMTERFKKQDGTAGEQTEFLTCEVWGKESIFPFLKKGVQVYVEGPIRTEKWNDQNNQPHYSTKCRVQSIRLLSQAQQQSQPRQQSAPPAPQTYSQPAQPSRPGRGAQGQLPYQPYGAVANPPQQPPMAQQLDPSNYPGDLPFD